MAEIIPAEHPECIDIAVRLLLEGQLVCYPTDTVYGIGAAAGNESAVRRMFAVKGRPLSKAVPLLIADVGAASWLADMTPVAQKLSAKFWPGPLTLVLRKKPEFRSLALAGQDTIALRVPDNYVTRAVIRALDEPVTGSSANRAGAPSPVSAAEVAFQLGEMVSLVIDGGPTRRGVESTVVDLTDGPPKVLREGAISRVELGLALGKEVA